ncbi:integrase catalytic domain-containing protein [Trichonephila clavipes]|nr:integrase catalytic domain-containing protein [Trichonephila clavipes]
MLNKEFPRTYLVIIDIQVIYCVQLCLPHKCGEQLGASRVSHPDEADCSTAAALVNFQDNSGRRNFRRIFCDKPHNSSECFSARKLPLEEKRKLLVQKHACFRCLKTGHVSRSCKYKVKCLSCDKNHLVKS